MRIALTFLAVLTFLSVAVDTGYAQSKMSLGVGAHYLKTLGDIKDVPGFDENAFSFTASFQYSLTLLTIEGDVEWVPDFGGSDKSLIQPQAYALLGSFIYGGAGIGIGSFDGEWQDSPFYALRAGVKVPLGGIGLDVNANYRFQNSQVFEEIDEDDLDALTFGAFVRFGL